ncbi:MAG: hypothetical protein IPK64_08005 [bacterium]|nr:hypothetical protein [bacterium]
MTEHRGFGVGRRDRPSLVAASAALGVLLLAAAASWWPRTAPRPGGVVVVVLDPTGDERRLASTWPALGRVLAGPDRVVPQLEVARTRTRFAELLPGADFAICPDGVALGLDAGAWAPLAAGRRSAPRNLRPRGVLVSRRQAGHEADLASAPWLARPASVIFGDSLGLAATGSLRPAGVPGNAVPAGGAWGPDPYDHAPALHALRLGAFEHALVRQWDAERFRAQGLLPDADWTITELTVPVPDLVVLAARRLPAPERLALGERLAGIGRELTDLTPDERELASALPNVGLAGFNLLIDPDFDLVRAQFAADWPPDRP